MTYTRGSPTQSQSLPNLVGTIGRGALLLNGSQNWMQPVSHNCQNLQQLETRQQPALTEDGAFRPEHTGGHLNFLNIV